MSTGTAYEVADILERELGCDGAVRYAEKISRSEGPLAAQYAEAATLLKQRKDSEKGVA